MTRQCAYSPDCRRAPRETAPDGTKYANCFDHHGQLTVSSWWCRSVNRELPPLVVGGVPVLTRAGSEPPPAEPAPHHDYRHGAGPVFAVPSLDAAAGSVPDALVATMPGASR